MYDSIDAFSSMRQLQQTAETRLAKTTHDLAKAELSIEAPVELMTAMHESSLATTLARTANYMNGNTLDILA